MLRIPRHLFEELVRLCIAGYPFEVCGLLIGKQEGEKPLVTAFHPAKNLNTDRARDRYELDPADFQYADARAREQHLDVIGMYHSHPDCEPQASTTDHERAWEGYSYLIIALQHHQLDSYKSWCLKKGRMIEEPVEVIDAEGTYTDAAAKLHRR